MSDFLSPPFGPLNGLHHFIISHDVGFSPAGVALYLAPLGFIYAQCYLLLNKSDTRYHRMALGIAALAGMWHAWTTIRFADPWHVPLNHVSTMPYIHFMGKAVEFSLLQDPIRDPVRRSTQALSAWGLFINSRLIGLGGIGLDDLAGTPNALATGVPERQFRLLVADCATGWRPKSRPLATLRHALYALFCFGTVDTLFHLVRLIDPVFNQPNGGKDIFWTVTARRFVALPGTLDFVLPRLAVVLVAEGILGVVIWLVLEGLYQGGATVHLLLGWPVKEWDLDLLAFPAGSTSLIEFWGARWHATFRHFFVILSQLLLRLLHLPTDKMYIFLATFLFSGLHHAISEIAMPTSARPASLVIFFILSGIGCSLELTYKRVTGRMVGGIIGRMWCGAFMATTGLLSMPAWLDSGYGACRITPDGTPGYHLAHWLAKHVLRVD